MKRKKKQSYSPSKKKKVEGEIDLRYNFKNYDELSDFSIVHEIKKCNSSPPCGECFNTCSCGKKFETFNSLKSHVKLSEKLSMVCTLCFLKLSFFFIGQGITFIN